MNLSEMPLTPSAPQHPTLGQSPAPEHKEGATAERRLVAIVPALGIAATLGGVIAAGENRLSAYLLLGLGLAVTATLVVLVRNWSHQAQAREQEQARLLERLWRDGTESASAWKEAPAMLFRTDANGAWTQVNAALVAATGSPPEDLLSDGWWLRVDRRDLVAMDEPWRAALAERKPFEACCRRSSPTGEKRWYRVRASPLADAPGFCGSVDAIDSEIALRDSLREMEEQRDLVLDGLNAAYFDWDVPAGRIYLTRQWKKMLGGDASPSTFTTAEAETLAHPEDRGPAHAHAIAALNGATPFYHVEHRVRRQDGQWIWLESHGKVVARAADGSALRMVGYNLDITLKKRLEAALRDAEAHHREVLDEVSEVLFRTDAAGHFIYLNAAWAELTGHPVDESIGRPMNHFVHPDDRAEIFHLLRGLTEGKLAEIRHEIRAAGKDGFDRWLELRLGPMRDAEGALIGTAGTMHDVTERHRAELELRRAKESAESANRVKTDFLANISHEIRTPLHGIVGMTDLLLESKLDDASREHLQLIRSSSSTLLRTLNEVLDFSRIEAGKMGIELGEFPLSQALQQASKAHAVAAARKGVVLRLKVAPDVPDTLTGDAKRLEQVLDHLLDNAIKFTGKGEVELSVLLRAELSERVMLEFVVKDTGSGFSSQQRETLFNAFSHPARPEDGRQQGVGLGLAICKRLAEMMGGEIWAESAPGRGSTFHFTARFYRPNPLVERAMALPATNTREQPAKVSHSTGLTVLLVEDDEINQKVASSLLRSLGHYPTAVATGADAIVAWETTRYDLVIMDLQLPLMGGVEAARYIREKEAERGGHQPIIAMTAHTDGDYRARCKEIAVDEFLVKPVDRDTLAAAIDRVAALAEKPGAARPPRNTANSALDLDTALARINNDQPMLLKIIELFRERYPLTLDLCRRAMTEGDAPALANAAHALKGMASTIGALRLQAMAGALEKSARESRLQDGAAVLERVEAAAQELAPMLEQALQTLRPASAMAS